MSAAWFWGILIFQFGIYLIAIRQLQQRHMILAQALMGQIQILNHTIEVLAPLLRKGSENPPGPR